MSVQASALILAWIAIAMLALAMAGLLRQVRALSAQMTQTPVRANALTGAPAPEFQGTALQRDRPTLLLFVSANCNVCQERLRELESLADQDGKLSYVAVFPGPADDLPTQHVQVLQNQSAAFRSFSIPVTPFGVVVAADGVVSHAAAVGSSSALHELTGTAKGLL
jgi:cytochrome oxidase Cu insertion factor (SCO1/SenC/PrrC family)